MKAELPYYHNRIRVILVTPCRFVSVMINEMNKKT